MIYKNVLETIGRTPIIQMNKCVPKSEHTFFGKLEFFNPGGSVKDRIGLSIIEDGEKSGKLKPGGTIIEATSGNTGVGLAMVAAINPRKQACIHDFRYELIFRFSLPPYKAYYAPPGEARGLWS